MIIAIHADARGFSTDWIEYCDNNSIEYKIVNCYSTNIVNDVKSCDALMWNWYHDDYSAQLFARQLTQSLEISGLFCFPNVNTSWHYDDKLGQKYLFESLDVKTAVSSVFYSQNEALKYLETLNLPVVVKTRGGAGSSNVMLVNTEKQYKKVVRKCFGSGLKPINRMSFLQDAAKALLNDVNKASLDRFLRAIYRFFIPSDFEKFYPKQNGYLYLQEFFPNNEYDTRVIIVNNKAFAIKRMCREGDFRASGSGRIIYKKEEIDIQCVRDAFLANKKIKSDSIAFDFIYNREGQPVIIEISYAYSKDGYLDCEGYWDEQMDWHHGAFNAQYWMVDSIIAKKKFN
jgi:glutathione synthase/RimK-type ligase-like ATP-grasp enzyme